jgi:thiamine monophosphate kinase
LMACDSSSGSDAVRYDATGKSLILNADMLVSDGDFKSNHAKHQAAAAG